MNSNIKKELEKIIEDTRKEYNLPSISLTLRHGDLKYSHAVGKSDLELDIDATPDSIYCIGSSTKAFIAMALCILEERAKINLDKPVKTYLPWFKMYDDYTTKNLTLRDALSHRSGMPRHDTSWLNTPERTTIEQVKALEFLEPAYPIRYKFHYQNHMFMLATVVVEEITGMPWGDYVNENILKPLNMNDTFIYGDRIDDADIRKARPYLKHDGENVRMPYNYAKTSGGAGTMYSSTNDMLKWLDFQLHGNDNIISREKLKDMHSSHMVMDHRDVYRIFFDEVEFTTYGLAWFVDSYRGVKLIHHGGTLDGFKSEQIFAPREDISISILSNLNQTTAVVSMGYEIIDLLLGLEKIDWNRKYIDAGKKLDEIEREKNRIAEEKAFKMKSSLKNIVDYEGEYTHSGYGSIKIISKDENLYMETIGMQIPIMAFGEDKFHMAVGSFGICFTVDFIRDEDNIVKSLSIPLEEFIKNPIIFVKKI